MRSPAPTRLPFLLYVIVLLILTAGCTSGGEKLRLNKNDIYALNRMQDVSPWVFRKSSLELQAYGRGAVEVKFEGEAVRKSEGENGPLWLPVAFTRELPQFYKVSGGNASETVELEAYKTEGGLWCVTAIVPLSSPQSITPLTTISPATSLSLAQPTVPLKLSVLIVSPEFSESLPLLLPVGQASGSVNASVSLPNGSRFTGLSINSDNSSAEQETLLTVFPPSLSGGTVRGVARLTPDSGSAWDFSSVTFSSSSFYIYQYPLLVMLFGITGLWYWLSLRGRVRIASEIAELYLGKVTAFFKWEREFEENKNLDYGPDINDMLEITSRLNIGSLGERLFAIWREIDSIIHSFEVEEVRESSKAFEFSHQLRRRKQQLYELNYELEKESVYERKDSELWKHYLEYAKYFEVRIDYLIHFSRQLGYRYRLMNILQSSTLFLLIFIVAVFFLLFFLVPRVFGEGSSQESIGVVSESATALSNIGMETGTDDFKAEKLPMSLTFTALSSSADKQAVSLKVDSNSGVSIESASIAPAPAEVTVADNEARFNVPANKVPPYYFLLALKDPTARIVGAKLSPSFLDAIRSGKKFKLDVSYKDAQTIERNAWGGWINKFPFETKKVVIPVMLDQPALWSEMLIKYPRDYVGDDISATGIDANFKDDGQNIKMTGGGKDSPIPVAAGQPVLITVEFRRTWLQRGFLTGGQILFGIIAGIILGYLLAKPSQKTKVVGAGVELLVIAGSVLVIRNSVYGSYSDLPKLLFSGQIPTVFELFTIGSALLFLITTIITYRTKV